MGSPTLGWSKKTRMSLWRALPHFVESNEQQAPGWCQEWALVVFTWFTIFNFGCGAIRLDILNSNSEKTQVDRYLWDCCSEERKNSIKKSSDSSRQLLLNTFYWNIGLKLQKNSWGHSKMPSVLTRQLFGRMEFYYGQKNQASQKGAEGFKEESSATLREGFGWGKAEAQGKTKNSREESRRKRRQFRLWFLQDSEDSQSSLLDELQHVQPPPRVDHLDVMGRLTPSMNGNQEFTTPRPLMSQAGPSHWDLCSWWRDVILMISSRSVGAPAFQNELKLLQVFVPTEEAPDGVTGSDISVDIQPIGD
jgi:hypothetical protein